MNILKIEFPETLVTLTRFYKINNAQKARLQTEETITLAAYKEVEKSLLRK